MRKVKKLDAMLKDAETTSSSKLQKEPSVALSVRVDINRYDRLHSYKKKYKMSHKDMIIEAIDLWLKAQEDISNRVRPNTELEAETA